MPTRGTRPTQVRLTDADKAKIGAIQERYGLPSLAAAIRYTVEVVYRQLPPDPPRPKKKSGKGA